MYGRFKFSLVIYLVTCIHCCFSFVFFHFHLFFNIADVKTEASNQNSKSATIEMYAPSSYNDTVTGETLSSVSEKSDSYSNEGSQLDYMVSKHVHMNS